MRKLEFTAVTLTAIALFCSPSAHANTITINGGESPTFPPTFTTLLSAGSPVTLPATSCCGATNSFLVQATAEGTPNMPLGDFDSNTITLNTGGPGTLILWFTETGLTAPVGTVAYTSSLTSNSLTGGITSVTLATFISPTNSVSPPNGTALDSASFTTIGLQTATTTVSTGAGPYSLQEVYTIVSTGVGAANLTIDLTATATPEPNSLALAGLGLLGFGLLLKRVRRQA